MRNRAGALGPQGINLAVESLTAALRRVRGEVAAPHAALRAQALQLRNLHATLDLLRHLLHRLKLVAKLRVRARPRPRSAATRRSLAPHATCHLGQPTLRIARRGRLLVNVTRARPRGAGAAGGGAGGRRRRARRARPGEGRAAALRRGRRRRRGRPGRPGGGGRRRRAAALRRPASPRAGGGAAGLCHHRAVAVSAACSLGRHEL
jgi:hypothetical protein